MTQPNEAVGGASDTVVAAEPTLEDRLSAAMTDEDQEQPEEDQPDASPADDEEPIAADEDAEVEAEDVPEGDEPPITPPVSWTAEEKEVFKGLPRDVQEVVSRREADREKFVQSKAQEARQASVEAEKRALDALSNRLQAHSAAVSRLMVQVPQRPSHQLQADDPYSYAEQMDAYERATAHNQWIEQSYSSAVQEAQRAQQVIQQQSLQETEAALREKFPEYLDPTEGPKLRQELGSIALELGYSVDQLANVDANDILAMRQVATYKAKAEKYDALVAKKMEGVRAAKNLPRVSRPGTAQGGKAAANQRYTADRKAMREGDRDAAARVFQRFL